MASRLPLLQACLREKAKSAFVHVFIMAIILYLRDTLFLFVSVYNFFFLLFTFQLVNSNGSRGLLSQAEFIERAKSMLMKSAFLLPYHIRMSGFLRACSPFFLAVQLVCECELASLKCYVEIYLRCIFLCLHPS